MDFFYTVKQIGIFIICAQIIMHFKPSAKYEKYLKLLISVMVLVQVIMPMINFISGKDDEYFWTKVKEIQTDIDKSMEQLEIENAINEETIINQTLEEIKSRINNLISDKNMQIKEVEYREQNGENKLIFYMTENTYEQTVNIKVDTTHLGEQEVMGKAVTRRTMDGRQKHSEELQVLYNLTKKELGLEKEQIEVVWNG